ncbi:probable 2-oxoglutarate-dependent dioxygenase ANS isoform X1 [Cucurbita pepo subsp. pepo]|uniref:probable 2-oxoglutarate-dependent dioxygenase ANS isoform X1 n=1 Tax=Cucurbita pepo subsp. pepo TaxID=3664 RepID=UPI000C9D56DC|nr:probable 2-oxoglutarate-dependent dioxygenase ANS isoform X1 [Cucurbita pepo subsp. pepo]
MVNSGIPTADLSPFFTEGDEGGKKKAIEIIGKACSDLGFFQVVNHGVPVELMAKALGRSKEFFGYPLDRKLEASPQPSAPLPAGYGRPPPHSPDKNEFFLMFPPDSTFNVFPSNPQGFSCVLKELFSSFVKTASIVESIINDCLGLPPNFLSEYNNDRRWDLMSTFRYPCASEVENIGVREHKDVNCITFVFQDEVGGLELKTDVDQWIPITPDQTTLVVNVGDVVQVLSNDRYKSASHRVVRQAGRERHSFAFFYNIGGDKWVEPLPDFSTDIDEAPKYRGFLYKEYLQLRLRNKTHPPSRPQDIINISYYSTST